MPDIFVEQIIKKKRDTSDILKIVLVILALFAVDSAVLIIGITRPVFPAVFAIGIYLAYNYIRNLSMEYEYAVTNGDLDVDSIAGRRKRRRVLSMSVRRIALLAPATEKYQAELNSNSIRNVIDASISPKSEGLWFARYEDDAGVDCLLLFNPNEKVLRALVRVIPNKAKDVPPELLTRGDEY